MRSPGPTRTPSRSTRSDPGSGVRTVLVAVTGKASPILTEALWALAKARDFPDKLVVVTTEEGRDEIVNSLLTLQDSTGQFPGKNVWEALIQDVEYILGESVTRDIQSWSPHSKAGLVIAGTGSSRPGRGTRDVRDRRKAETFGSALFDVIAAHKAKGWRVLGLMGGGRKQMEYLLYGCMTLLASSDDRLLTVTVHPESWARATPRFYFPTRTPTLHHLPSPPRKPGSTAQDHPQSTQGAKVHLVDVPVPILGSPQEGNAQSIRIARSRFQDAFGGFNPDIQGVQSIRIDITCSQLHVDETAINLGRAEIATYSFLAARTRARITPGKPTLIELAGEWDLWLKGLGTNRPKEWAGIKLDAATISKALHRIRGLIAQKGLLTVSASIVPGGHGHLQIPNIDLVHGLPAGSVDAFDAVS